VLGEIESWKRVWNRSAAFIGGKEEVGATKNPFFNHLVFADIIWLGAFYVCAGANENY